jgi:uncharacterized membrane protein
MGWGHVGVGPRFFRQEKVVVTSVLVGKYTRLQNADRIGAVACASFCVTFVCVYVAYYLRLSYFLYDHYGMSAFDLGIFDQAVWLISRGRAPWVTLRGLHILADHSSLILYLIAPLYRLWSSPKLLLLLQTLALAGGALPVYGLGVHYTKSAIFGLVMACLYLLFPTIQWTNAYQFHPDAFAPVLFLGALWMYEKQNYGGYFSLLLLASLTKETTGAIIFVVGCLLCFKNLRVGLATCLLGGLVEWTMLNIIKHFNGGYPSAYYLLYASYGQSAVAIIKTLLLHPLYIVKALFGHTGLLYLWHLLGIFGFLPLFAPEWLFVAVPGILFVVLVEPTHVEVAAGYHSLYAVPFVVMAALVGGKRIWLHLPQWWARTEIGLFCLFWGIGFSFLYSPLNPRFFSIRVFDILDDNGVHEIDQMLSIIPPHAVVSAQSALTTHLSHRAFIYNFPMPFCRQGWGGTPQALRHILDQTPPSPQVFKTISQAYANLRVDYIALCPMLSSFPVMAPYCDRFILILLHCRRYGIIEIGCDGILLQRGADYAAGLRKLSSLSGVPIRCESDIDRAYMTWRECQVAIDVP